MRGFQSFVILRSCQALTSKLFRNTCACQPGRCLRSCVALVSSTFQPRIRMCCEFEGRWVSFFFFFFATRWRSRLKGKLLSCMHSYVCKCALICAACVLWHAKDRANCRIFIHTNKLCLLVLLLLFDNCSSFN